MRSWIMASLLLATSAAAEPPRDISPMTLPGGGGYIQPGNPNRSITSVGRESAFVRQREARHRAATHTGAHTGAVAHTVTAAHTIPCASHKGPRRCLVHNAGVTLERRTSNNACRSGRDWHYDARSITVANGCRALFSYKPRS
ncbi:DUF3011 domain-containing protein [Sphingosinicellaceae bacterium]|nr:DUF3011 domain-containing protein [Sphingosinicellaceae bacterium]